MKQWAFTICTAMVICGVAQMILPKAGVEKMFRVTVSIFFLCCLLTPFVLRDSSLMIDIRQPSQQEINEMAEKITRISEEHAGGAAAENVKKNIEDKLTEMGINYRSITININTNGQRGEQGLTCEIVLEEMEKPREPIIVATLKGILGARPDIAYA